MVPYPPCRTARAVALVVGELLASLRGPASRRAACLGGRGPAERAEGIGQIREGGAGQRGPQQAVELAVEDEGGDAQELRARAGQLPDRRAPVLRVGPAGPHARR